MGHRERQRARRPPVMPARVVYATVVVGVALGLACGIGVGRAFHGGAMGWIGGVSSAVVSMTVVVFWITYCVSRRERARRLDAATTAAGEPR